jgi:hypothetical protein
MECDVNSLFFSEDFLVEDWLWWRSGFMQIDCIFEGGAVFLRMR